MVAHRPALAVLLLLSIGAQRSVQLATSVVPLYLDNPALDLNAARRTKNVAVRARGCNRKRQVQP